MEHGGTTACILNATNEIAVDAFLNDKISFSEISQLNHDVVKSAEIITKPVYEDYVSSDSSARQSALNLIQ
ncbi:MAG: 1-deoxy-D-xylulose-5-phosphate reductoisomerase, partial [Crocinitomicaceae bacterium]|nr:1-deoxy-D-xylulose-5-phosphate reductoisomerase [Crocinitomicaceae bacterium]